MAIRKDACVRCGEVLHVSLLSQIDDGEMGLTSPLECVPCWTAALFGEALPAGQLALPMEGEDA